MNGVLSRAYSLPSPLLTTKQGRWWTELQSLIQNHNHQLSNSILNCLNHEKKHEKKNLN